MGSDEVINSTPNNPAEGPKPFTDLDRANFYRGLAERFQGIVTEHGELNNPQHLLDDCLGLVDEFSQMADELDPQPTTGSREVLVVPDHAEGTFGIVLTPRGRVVRTHDSDHEVGDEVEEPQEYVDPRFEPSGF